MGEWAMIVQDAIQPDITTWGGEQPRPSAVLPDFAMRGSKRPRWKKSRFVRRVIKMVLIALLTLIIFLIFAQPVAAALTEAIILN
jgi:hypothetical protein